MSTQQQRQEWRELAAAVQDDMKGALVAGKTTQERNYRVISTTSAGWLADCYTEEIANLLAAARTAVPQLLADVDALTQERDAYARMLDAEMLRRQDAESDILRLTEDDTQSAFERTAALRAERDAAYRAIERMSRKQTEMHDTLQARNAALTAERDALAAAWAQVVAISDEMNPKQGGPFGGDTNIAAYNMSRVRDVVREWKEAQNAVFE